ncbi:hypothetical protein ZK99_004771 [Salmonella enterica subsp. enterica]|uniref:Uncharacterized protein n=1 Tax=Salmonella enterica subsp. enterica serovar Kottbus TaxID=224727 RepID=A0A5J0SBS1_SALET|nr:hypothetical protein [Salmonella enterica subsp. enterica serovar Newport]EBQ9797407.1 hypothetical protein [Salmonella enterica subsp. enterica serovar Kottbus]ECA9706485.1 hypothetical protein [Salmonella enterica subsp. enterica serovar Bredeney]EDE8444751.1 hypothetical protein [Salmonella enterica subsp. enterica serovar Pomona]EDJ1502855.1 hypothetical protein [Salmonella enterica]EDN4396920.1 hypothetical protein [Salmonella enterica subsp. enterica]HCK3133604.1 hypothetical protein
MNHDNQEHDDNLRMATGHLREHPDEGNDDLKLGHGMYIPSDDAVPLSSVHKPASVPTPTDEDSD